MKTCAKSLVTSMALAAAGMIGPMSPLAFAGDMPDMHDPHAHHHHMMQMPQTTRQTVEYTVPKVKLVRDDGKTVALTDELNDGRPVVLSFIYTTCTAVCPLVSQTLSQLQRKLGADRDRVHLVSISIDPEQDTPARLAAYAKKYGAGPEWQHYTGTTSASIATQRAFGAYRGDKMNHTPISFLRAAPDKPWIRIEGFATADDLLGELRTMLPPAEFHDIELAPFPSPERVKQARSVGHSEFPPAAGRLNCKRSASMNKISLILACGLFAANLAVSAQAADYGKPDAAMEKMMGKHKMTGTVDKIDHAKGTLMLKSGMADMSLHFPPPSLKDIKNGDTITVEMSFMKDESAMK